MYKFNPTAAKESENHSAYLNETGKYKGKFTRAEKLVSTQKGTHGIGFTFMAESKQTTRFNLWTMDSAGKTFNGLNFVNAIMACMRLREIKPVPGQVERWDAEQKKNVPADAEVFPELVGKDIGLLLRNTEYAKMKDGRKTGETGWQLELYGVFEHSTELTASEILERKTKPEKLASIVASVTDKPMKSRPVAGSGAAPSSGHMPPTGFEGMDDDIPF